MRDRSVPPIHSRRRCVSVLPIALTVSLAVLAGASMPPRAAFAQEPQPPPAPATLPGLAQDPPAEAGTLAVTVVAADTKQPITNAVVRYESLGTLAQSANVDPTTGVATIPNVRPGTYTVSVETTAQYSPKTVADVTVTAGQTTSITVELTPIATVVNTGGKILAIDPEEVSNVTIRDRAFFERNALGAGNKQSLVEQLRSVPGFVPDALNQIHPRGENSISKAYYIDGFLVPSLQAGNAAQFFLPQTIDRATVRVAGYPARYGGGSGAIVDLDLRDARVDRFLDYNLRFGGFNTRELYINFGNSTTLATGNPFRRRRAPVNPNAPRLRYVFSLSQRYTDNALEPPQDDEQTSENYGASEIFFGKLGFDLTQGGAFVPGGKDISAILNFSSGRTGIARRTGLGGEFAGFGQGFGFVGNRGSDSGLLSQEDLGQRLRQKDNNSLTVLQYRMQDAKGMLSTFALGASRSTQTVINYGTRSVFGTPNFPIDNSIDFIPTVLNETDQIQFQADFVPLPLGGIHQLRYGVLYHDIRGTDSYQLIPQSQQAFGELARIDPRLAPQGGVPAVVVAEKSGGYLAAYVEDTFQLRNQMRFNVGARVDSYRMSADSGALGSVRSVNKTELSPRINVSYLLPETSRLRFLSSQPTILRVSYNRLFATPNANQGVVLTRQPGSSGINPVNGVGAQTVDQYDISVERQLSPKQVIKFSLYSKDIQRTLTTQQFVLGAQVGTLAVFNQGDGGVDGAELAYELRPTTLRNGSTIAGYVVYANATTAPDGRGQFNNLGQQVVTPFYEFDQEDTLTLGASYQLASGPSAAFSLYYGSGLLSSSRKVFGSTVPFSGRDSVTEFNVRLSSGPRFFAKRASVELEVENLFNGRGLLNFRSGIAGTRFQQGRRIFLALNGRL